jgi:hypothetical protein
VEATEVAVEDLALSCNVTKVPHVAQPLENDFSSLHQFLCENWTCQCFISKTCCVHGHSWVRGVSDTGATHDQYNRDHLYLRHWTLIAAA